jgi:ribosome-associated protein
MENSRKIFIPVRELIEIFSRASGRGGQNVNKVETKVELHWNVNASMAFGDPAKKRIHEVLKNKINKDGELIVSCQSQRSQEQNRVEAISKLNALVAKALTPQKKRKAMKPTRIAKERRLEEKKIVSLKKTARRLVEV